MSGESALRLLREVHGSLADVRESALRLLREVHAVLADVRVCNFHIDIRDPKLQKNKCGTQDGGFDTSEGMQCLKFL